MRILQWSPVLPCVLNVEHRQRLFWTLLSCWWDMKWEHVLLGDRKVAFCEGFVPAEHLCKATHCLIKVTVLLVVPISLMWKCCLFALVDAFYYQILEIQGSNFFPGMMIWPYIFFCQRLFVNIPLILPLMFANILFVLPHISHCVPVQHLFRSLTLWIPNWYILCFIIFSCNIQRYATIKCQFIELYFRLGLKYWCSVIAK